MDTIRKIFMIFARVIFILCLITIGIFVAVLLAILATAIIIYGGLLIAVIGEAVGNWFDIILLLMLLGSGGFFLAGIWGGIKKDG